jgi:centractin
LLTEPPHNPRTNRSNIAETFFESMDAPAIFIAQQAILSLYAFGKTTGLVIESGDGVTQCVPVYEGYSIQNAVERIDLGGRDVTEYLRLLLRKSGYNFVTSVRLNRLKTLNFQTN